MTRARPAGRTTAALAALAVALAPGGSRAASPAPAGPAASAVELLRDFTIAIPPGSKTAVRLLVSPLPDDAVDRLGPSAPLFAAGPGAVWLGLEPGLLVNASMGYRLRPAVKVSDIAVLEGGGLLVATGDALGYLVPEASPGATGAGGAGTIAFQPVVDLPVAEARLAAGPRGALYLFGPALEGDGQAVYLLSPEPAGAVPGAPRALRTIRRVFSTSERIAAVAGDGAETYVATGRLVVKISGAAGAMSPVLLHPKEPVTGLALTRKGLLFYATGSGVGVVSPRGAVQLVKAPRVALRAAGDSLYLLLQGSLAVVEVEGTEPYRLAAPPARKAP